MATNYQNKWNPETNVPRHTMIMGRVLFSDSSGTVAACRPSAGLSAAAGAGLMFTASRVSAGVFRIAFTEGYLQDVVFEAELNPAYSTTFNVTSTGYVVQATQYDATTNSFLIYVGTATSSSVTTTVAADPPATSALVFRGTFINTISPASL